MARPSEGLGNSGSTHVTVNGGPDKTVGCKLCHEKKKMVLRTSLAVQWLRLRTSTAGGTGSIPGQGTKIPHAKGNGKKGSKQGGRKKETVV